MQPIAVGLVDHGQTVGGLRALQGVDRPGGTAVGRHATQQSQGQDQESCCRTGPTQCSSGHNQPHSGGVVMVLTPSEMLPLGTPLPAFSLERATGGRWETAALEAKPCLLYTSDAADE